MRQAQLQAQRKKKMAKARNSNSNGANSAAAQPPPASQARPPQYSQVPELLQIICSLSMQQKLPPETCFFAIYHLVNMERQYAHDAGFYQLVQAKNEGMVQNFIQTCLHSMTQSQSSAESGKGATEGGEPTEGGDHVERPASTAEENAPASDGTIEGDPASTTEEGTIEGDPATPPATDDDATTAGEGEAATEMES